MHLLLSDGSGGRLSYKLLGTDCSSLGMGGSLVSEQPGPCQTSDWGKDENEGLNVCTFQIPCTTLAGNKAEGVSFTFGHCFMFNIMKQACERNKFGGGGRAEIFIQAS